MNSLLCEVFPEKLIIISPEDRPWFNEQLRLLKRQRMRQYQRHGKNDKYDELKTRFDEKLKHEMLKYLEKIAIEVSEGRRGSTYPALKRLGLRPGEEIQSGFQLPMHAEQNLSPAQSAEVIAEHFSRISQEYEPLNIYNLPPNVQSFVHTCNQSLAPKLTVQDVHKRITQAKKPNGLVPGDLPKRLVKHCSATLAVPVTAIFNRITTSAEYPNPWKIEEQNALAKVNPPESEDDLRNIAKTPFFSKVYESFIGGWLLPIIKSFLDPGQCGLKGFSITHYLIKLLHFIHATLDLRNPRLWLLLV